MDINWQLKQTAEQSRLAAHDKEYQSWKSARAVAVGTISVTVNGRTYDGDEVSQNRMARAVAAADSLDELVSWTLTDNSVALVQVRDLKEALRLAGLKQTEIWIEGRPDL